MTDKEAQRFASMHSRIYKLDDGTIVDEIVNDDGVVLAKTVTPPAVMMPSGLLDWLPDYVDAARTDPHAFDPTSSKLIPPSMEDWERWSRKSASPTDPLDVEYDGVKLRDLIEWDRRRRQDDSGCGIRWGGELTVTQRAAISAHWSAELRQRVEATKEKQRTQVVVDGDDE